MLNRTRAYRIPIASVFMALAMTCAEGQSAMILQTVDTLPTGQYAKTDLAQTMSVPAFNSSLGTLTSVSYSIINEVVPIGGTLLNKSAGTVPLFTISDTVKLTASFASTSTTNNLNVSSSYQDVAKGATVNFAGFNLMGTSVSTTITDSSLLRSFEGTSPLLFNFTANAVVMIGGTGGNSFANILTEARATLQIIYNFTPTGVPEPASMAMTALGGLVTFGWVRTRRREPSAN